LTARSLQGAAAYGALRAYQSARGVDVNVGTPVDVRASQKEMNMLDLLTEQHRTQLEEYGYGTQATNYYAEAQLATAQAAQTGAAAPLNIASSLIGGAGTALSRFSWMQQNAGGAAIVASILAIGARDADDHAHDRGRAPVRLDR
jgi:hypothetical protein